MGRPRILSDDERREKRRIKSAKWREANRERAREIGRNSMKKAAAARAIAAGRVPGKCGPKPVLTEEQKKAKRAAKMRKFYANNPSVLEKAKIREQSKRDGTFVSRALPRLTEDQKRLAGVVCSSVRRTRIRGNGGKHTRQDIETMYADQNGLCNCCQHDLSAAKWHVDHIIPVSAGGSSDPANLQVLCETCNLTKGAKISHVTSHIAAKEAVKCTSTRV